MDQYDAGEIHVCRKLGWEYTKAHLDLYDSQARHQQEELAELRLRHMRRIQAEELIRQLTTPPGEMESLELDTDDEDDEDWSIQGDWGIRWLGPGPILLPPGAGHIYVDGHLIIPLPPAEEEEN